MRVHLIEMLNFAGFISLIFVSEGVKLSPGSDRPEPGPLVPPRGWYSKYRRNVDQLTAGRVERGWGGGAVDRPRCLNNRLHLPKDSE